MADNKKTLIISSLQIILMSTGVISIAILISLSMPNFLNYATYNPLLFLFATLRSWLQPPYLYVIINAIIITIVASSRLHHHHHDKVVEMETPPPIPLHDLHHHHQHDNDVISLRPNGVVSVAEAVVGPTVVIAAGHNYNDVVPENNDDEIIKSKVIFNDDDKENVEIIKQTNIKEDEKSRVVEGSTWTSPPKSTPLTRQQALEKVSPEFFLERPPVSSRFGHHRRPARANQAEGGKALRVSKPKKHDTLESTWKTITEGRHIPLTRHLKKSDTTWEHHNCQIDLLDDSSLNPTAVKKSETFHERTNYVSPPVPSTKLKKEPSLSQDELNRRVEAFINKFNEEMRLQRQQSMQQFMDMINRAA